jgi:uncharacterized membrane protein YgdD (TMEM256/DUF423 family)
MVNKHIFWGSLVCAIAVALGAFGAHAWKDYLISIQRLDTFETASKYQMYGGFALLIVGIFQNQLASRSLKIAGYLFLIGSIIFPGSLYLICITQQKVFGAIAPIGGLTYILGFLLIAYTEVSGKR